MRNYFTLLFSVLLLGYLSSCQSESSEHNADSQPGNPAAEGFNAEGSDSTAINIADEVMMAMGGRHAWDETKYLTWNFFGARSLLWDKQSGEVRIEVPNDSSIYLINVQQDTGQVMLKGKVLTEPDSIKKYVDQGKQIWVNDSYWLLMPYKLKDSGVTLTYAGEDTLQTGAPAEALELRFEQVGYTPQNKYMVYIDPSDSLVKQWAYFPEASMDTPRFVTPWQDYQKYGHILLSGDRGERQITAIDVLESVPEGTFSNLDFQL